VIEDFFILQNERLLTEKAWAERQEMQWARKAAHNLATSISQIVFTSAVSVTFLTSKTSDVTLSLFGVVDTIYIGGVCVFPLCLFFMRPSLDLCAMQPEYLPYPHVPIQNFDSGTQIRVVPGGAQRKAPEWQLMDGWK
jgi:hypothetical protein